MTLLLLLLACTGPHPTEAPTQSAARDRHRDEAPQAPPGEEEADDRAIVRPGIEEKRGDVQTSPSASLPRTAIPTTGGPGCVPQCLEERRARGLSSSRLQVDCMRACGADGFVIRDARGITRSSGARVALEGEVTEVEESGRRGTAVVLSDGTKVWVTHGAPPQGWDGLAGREVRVIGTLWDGAPPPEPGGAPESGLAAAHLVDWEAPIPLRAEPIDTGGEEEAAPAAP